MRIAIFSRHYPEYCLRYARALSSFADTLLVLDSLEAQRQLDVAALRTGSARIVLLNMNVKQGGAAGLARALYHLKRFRPDVAHYQEVPDPITPLIMAAMRPFVRETVLTVHDPVPHSGADSRLPAAVMRLKQLGRTLATRFVVHGDRCMQALRAHRPDYAARALTSQHGVLMVPERDRSSEEEAATFLFFGRMEEYKGLDTLLEAVALLENEGRYYRFIVAGRGGAMTRLKPALARHRSFEVYDHYIMPADAQRFFARAKAVVLPYHDATQSGVAAAAYGNHKPVIASNVGGLADMVEHGRNGLLIAPKDPRVLAAALRIIAEDGATARELKAGAIETARGRLSWKQIARDLHAQLAS